LTLRKLTMLRSSMRRSMAASGSNLMCVEWFKVHELFDIAALGIGENAK
jgi:hypothetical protein